ncbi:hypothetical protein ABL78_0253 [Leptomonas seymouri]|uniref:Uncharacterized protein n=1 Tax=Leptomonas seymouri TaxID=5684 RepID=A0A0N0P9F4_LEPSE|nr:hypothetical protein ABL78_0253 [Leptomonas seymouri]|eukprot:KPI90657.1 hypothetical protein ABL78_0253 [Leptomonas seymouri]
MRAFLGFELAVVLLCGLVILFLSEVTSRFAASLHQNSIGSAASGVHVSLYWMRRSLTQPYRTWYLHDSESYSTVGLEGRLPHSVVEQGHILLPLHVFYLRLCGQWLRWAQPDLAHTLLTDDDGLMEGRHADARIPHLAIATFAAGCVILVGAPGSWLLMRALVRLLACAVHERERVARVLLPKEKYGTSLAAAAASSSTLPVATEDTEYSDDCRRNAMATKMAAPHSMHAAAALLGALLIVVVGLLPLLVLEVCTWQPWCLAGSLLVWAVYAALKNELQLHVSEAEMSDDAFDLTSPIVENGAVMCYSLKRQPSLVPLVSSVAIATLMSLTHTSCLYITPLLYLWALTSIWQHGYKRVLVKVKDSAAGGASTAAAANCAAAEADGYARVGYSCYLDKMHMNACACYASMCSVLGLLLIIAPWCWHQQPLLSFVDLFASPPLPTAADKTGAFTAKGVVETSFTGAREMQARCLSGPSPFYTCALPAANAWRLSEWFGLPWTHAAKSFTRLFTSQDEYVNRESAHWLAFVTVVATALLNAPSVLALSFYRIRKPLLSFETPVRYAAERAAHQAAQQEHVKAKQRSHHGGGGSGAAAQTSSTPSASAGNERKRATVLTCLCREEYLVKQVVLLAWMLSLSTMSCTVLFMRNGPVSGVLALPCSSLLAAVYAVVYMLRRAHTLAFCPLPSSSTTTEKSSESTRRPETGNLQQGDAPALMHHDCDDPRPLPASRWCTSAVAPSLAHAADVAWLQMIFVASVLSTGALSWAVVPSFLRQLVVGCGGACTAFCLWKLRRWVAVDLSSSIFFKSGCGASALLLLVLVAQLFPHSENRASLSGYLSVFTNKFGDMYASTGETALRAFIYQCTVACAAYMSCILYASLRIGRLSLEPEEVMLMPIEAEPTLFSKPPRAKKQQ